MRPKEREQLKGVVDNKIMRYCQCSSDLKQMAFIILNSLLLCFLGTVY